MSIYASRILRSDLQRLLGDQEFATVSMIAAQVDRELVKRLEALEAVAALADAPMSAGPDAVQTFLETRPDLNTIFGGGAFVTRADGTAIAAVPLVVDRVGMNYADRDYLAGALHDGKTTIGRPVMGRTERAPVLVMASPILSARGKVVGAIAGVTNLWLSSFLDQIAEGHYGKKGGFLLLSSPHHLIVTASDKRLVMKAFSEHDSNSLANHLATTIDGSGVMVDSSGADVLYSVKSIPRVGWRVAAFLPTAEVFEPIRDLQHRVWLAAMIVTLLAGGAIWRVLARQLSPLSATAEILANLSDDEHPVQALPVVRPDEIGKLVGGFNRLLETLSKRQSDLREREEYFRLIFENSGDAILFSLPHGLIESANPAACRLFGYSEDELRHLGHSGIMDQSDARLLVAVKQRSRTGRFYGELRCRHRDGRVLTVELNSTCFSDSKGVKHTVNQLRDISERKQTEQSLHLAASVFSHAREGIIIADATGKVIDVNEAFSRLTGFSREEVVGRSPSLLQSGRHGKELYSAMWDSLNKKGHWYGELWDRRKNGDIFVAMQTISAIRDDQGKTQQYVALFSDITEQKAHEKQLEHMAYYDVLTTLPNRVLLSDRLYQAMVQCQRRRQQLAVVYLDIDGFKVINDSHGHRTGDQLLIALGKAMKQTLREGDTLARLGGDEFVAVLLDLEQPEACVPTLNRLLSAAVRPVSIGDLVVQVSASLGVTFYPQAEAADADQLLRQADQAMYQAKLAGKNRYHFFDADKDRSMRGHHETLERVRKALVLREFVMYYQPKVNMRTGAVVGAEALIRWRHPQQGLLLPAKFLPAIEEHPLAVDIGEWVIDSVLSQMEDWNASGLSIPVSVNVGARQLLHGDFAQRLRDILAAHPTISPGDLEIEILETSALEDLVRVSKVIADCRVAGVHFSLDDFGTGYSSLTYLKRLSVSKLKIDQSFVRDMLDDPDDLSILRGILSLAGAFRREVVAEGVETVEHGTMLLQLGCELAQGYGIARPMPAAELPAWALNWQSDSTWRGVLQVHDDDLPLLLAGVEHRAWVAAMEGHLKDGKRPRPPLVLDRYPLDPWLDGAGEARYGHDEDFSAIKRLHLRAREVTAELFYLGDQESSPEVLNQFVELVDLRDSMCVFMRSHVVKSISRSRPKE